MKRDAVKENDLLILKLVKDYKNKKDTILGKTYNKLKKFDNKCCEMVPKPEKAGNFLFSGSFLDGGGF